VASRTHKFDGHGNPNRNHQTHHKNGPKRCFPAANGAPSQCHITNIRGNRFFTVPVLPSPMMLQEYPYYPFPVPVLNHERHVGKSGFVPVDQVCTNEGNRQMSHPRGDPHSWWPLVGTCGARPHPGPEGHGHFGQTWPNPQAFGTRRKQVCYEVLGRELLSDQWCLLLDSMDHHILALCIPCTITCLLYLWSR